MHSICILNYVEFGHSSLKIFTILELHFKSKMAAISMAKLDTKNKKYQVHTFIYLTFCKIFRNLH